MTAPLLPLDVLAGYTVTREGPHFYTLTPIERTATMATDWEAKGAADARAENAAVESNEAHKRATIREERSDPNGSDYWAGYAAEAERIEAEEPRDESAIYHSRAEWREQ